QSLRQFWCGEDVGQWLMVSNDHQILTTPNISTKLTQAIHDTPKLFLVRRVVSLATSQLLAADGHDVVSGDLLSRCRRLIENTTHSLVGSICCNVERLRVV